MTEEAREAAARSAWSRYSFTRYPANGQRVNAEVRAFDAGFDAGVVEGIRQAREAAEAGYGELAGSSAPTTPNAQTWMKAGASRAIATIDALGGEQ